METKLYAQVEGQNEAISQVVYSSNTSLCNKLMDSVQLGNKTLAARMDALVLEVTFFYIKPFNFTYLQYSFILFLFLMRLLIYIYIYIYMNCWI